MTGEHPHPSAQPRLGSGSLALGFGIAALGIPALVVRLTDPDLPVALETFLFGLGILGAAFILGAAAEASERDLPQSLSLAILAFIAVLPEYAVDLVFAWRAGDDITQAQYAVANMTGGNRLLIGVGWAAVLLAFFAIRRGRVIVLPTSISVEVAILLIASIYSLMIPLKGSISLVDTAVLFSLMAFYLYRISQQPRGEPELAGPVAGIVALSTWRRRSVVGAMFLYSGLVILASAEPFADGLIHTGVEFGIDEFLLVQWVAPLASESPEFLAAVYLVWRGNASGGLTALISSKVNQWTLLIGSLAVAFAISGETLAGLPMDSRQREEVLLTAAQSVFAVMLIVDKRLSASAAIPLFGLFVLQFFIPDETIRIILAGIYFVIAAGLFLLRYPMVGRVLRDGLFGGALAVEPEEEPRLPGAVPEGEVPDGTAER